MSLYIKEREREREREREIEIERELQFFCTTRWMFFFCFVFFVFFWLFFFFFCIFFFFFFFFFCIYIWHLCSYWYWYASLHQELDLGNLIHLRFTREITFLHPVCFPAYQNPFWKRINSKRKDIAQKESKFFPFKVDRFSEGRQNNFTNMPLLKVYSFPLRTLVQICYWCMPLYQLI